jgi:site-specific DNA-methyltransferase (adenine-specific)
LSDWREPFRHGEIVYDEDDGLIICGDCLDVLPTFPSRQINLVLSDLPYGITSCTWDSVIPLKRLWELYLSIVKQNAAIVLTAGQPFTSALVMSNLNLFRHEWIWIKNRGSNFANTVREPMKEHESVLIFSRDNWTYNPQLQERTGGGLSRVDYNIAYRSKSENYREFEGREKNIRPKKRVPSSWQKFNTEVGLHPTQKPVSLMTYFILTYSNEGELVLDNCVGSGSTLVAASQANRRFVGIDIKREYCELAAERVRAAKSGMTLAQYRQGQKGLF